jgi:hypothetical protein
MKWKRKRKMERAKRRWRWRRKGKGKNRLLSLCLHLDDLPDPRRDDFSSPRGKNREGASPKINAETRIRLKWRKL